MKSDVEVFFPQFATASHANAWLRDHPEWDQPIGTDILRYPAGHPLPGWRIHIRIPGKPSPGNTS